ncbi:MAG: XRE family transcriptional regulator [Proteobacteria bacterium]|nr:XRE family transcriptional regulator [Pseudomonadota bacterium]
MNNITFVMRQIEKTIVWEKEALFKLQRLAAKNMRVRRIAKRITMRGAAKMLGISASHYSDIENGHRNLTVELAIKADKAFANEN